MPGFSQPVWLVLLLTLPVLWYLYRQAREKKREDALAFSRVAVARIAGEGTKGADYHRILFLLSLAIVALLVIGLADPHVPLETRAEGVNVVLVMDVSGSMSATDYPPTRLEAAKTAATALMRDLAPEDYAGIVVFEAGATSAAYLSPDKERVARKLAGIQPRTGQTALGDGLVLAVDMAESIPNRKKVAILLSDGVNNAGIVSPDEAVKAARDRNIQVFTVGMGSDVPVVTGADPLGNPQYATLDEDTLRRIATTTGGKYFKSVDDRTLSSIYTGLNSEIVREPVETSIRDLFFASALLLVVLQLLIRYGRRRILP